MTRIVLDTNIWILFLINKDYSKLDSLLVSGNVKLLFSEELLSEFITVTERPKFKKYFATADVETILETIDDYAEFIKVKTATDICRDPKDNFLLSLCKDGFADYLITGDKDLLEITQFEKTKIITISNFLNDLK